MKSFVPSHFLSRSIRHLNFGHVKELAGILIVSKAQVLIESKAMKNEKLSSIEGKRSQGKRSFDIYM